MLKLNGVNMHESRERVAAAIWTHCHDTFAVAEERTAMATSTVHHLQFVLSLLFSYFLTKIYDWKHELAAFRGKRTVSEGLVPIDTTASSYTQHFEGRRRTCCDLTKVSEFIICRFGRFS